MTGYYDVVLTLIPLTIAGGTGAGMITGLDLQLAVPLAALVAVGLIAHAMFVRTPTDAVSATPQYVNAD